MSVFYLVLTTYLVVIKIDYSGFIQFQSNINMYCLLRAMLASYVSTRVKYTGTPCSTNLTSDHWRPPEVTGQSGRTRKCTEADSVNLLSAISQGPEVALIAGLLVFESFGSCRI